MGERRPSDSLRDLLGRVRDAFPMLAARNQLRMVLGDDAAGEVTDRVHPRRWPDAATAAAAGMEPERIPGFLDRVPPPLIGNALRAELVTGGDPSLLGSRALVCHAFGDHDLDDAGRCRDCGATT